jgi:hypothetical protein
MRVLSHHSQIRACVGDAVVDVTFRPTFLPGVHEADLDDVVAHHLVTNIGHAGGFWEDTDVPEKAADTDGMIGSEEHVALNEEAKKEANRARRKQRTSIAEEEAA